MTGDDSTDSSGLVPSADKELTPRSAALVRRALTDLCAASISPDDIERLRSALCGHSYDQRAQAARTVISIGPGFDLAQDAVAEILFCLVDSIDDASFEVHSSRVHDRNQQGLARWQEHRELLISALQSLVGPTVQVPELSPTHRYRYNEMGDAILAALVRGSRKTKMKAAEWFWRRDWQDHDIKRASSVLQVAVHETDDEELSLAVRYALSGLEHEDPDAVCSELADHATGSSTQAVKARARRYLELLPPRVSTETLGTVICRLGTDEDEANRAFAVSLWLDWFTTGERYRPDGNPTKQVEDCSNEVLDAMVPVLWEGFIRACNRHESGLSPSPRLVHVHHRENIRKAVKEWVGQWDALTWESLWGHHRAPRWWEPAAQTEIAVIFDDVAESDYRRYVAGKLLLLMRAAQERTGTADASEDSPTATEPPLRTR